MRSRHTIEDCLDCGMNRLWENALVKSRSPECVKRIVTGEQFVAAVAPQRHRHILSGQPAHQVGRQERTVRHRFIQPSQAFIDQLPGARNGKSFQFMIGLKLRANEQPVARLVKTLLGKSDAEGLQLPHGNMARGKSSDRRRVDPSTQENADRHVGEQAAMDSPIEQLAQLLPPFFLRISGQTLKRLEHQVPVFFHAIIQRPDIEKKRTTARKFENSIQNGPGRRNVAVSKIFLERRPRYRFRDAWMRCQRSQLGSEDKSIARTCVKEWLLAKAIPAAKKLAARAIVNRIRPHAIEPLGQSGSPFPVTEQDDLSIGMIALKFVTPLLQFSAQL